MRHEWIFDVLTDLKAYAIAHGMEGLARKAEEALDAARVEAALAPCETHPGLIPPPGRPSH